MKQHLARIVLGLATTLFFIGHAAKFYRVGFIDQLDDIIYDARLNLTRPGKADSRIVILDINEKSLGEVGRWPWSRNIMARLMDKLFDQHGVAVVAFDVFWSENDTSSGVGVLDALANKELKDVPGFHAAYRQLRGGLDYDGMFAASIKGRPVVLAYYLSSEESALRTNVIPAPVLPKGAFAGRYAPLTNWTGYTGNLPVFAANAAGAGHINPILGGDGVVRRVPLLAEIDGAYHEALSLAVVRTWLALQDGTGKLSPVEAGFPEGAVNTGMEWLTVGPLTVPVDEQSAALVPYAGPRFTFPYLPLADVLADRIRPGELKGKLALIGASAPGLLDIRSTPVGSNFPGVEIQANLISGMVNRTLKSKPAYILGAEAAFLLVGGLALSFLIPRFSALWATVATLAAVTLITGLNLLVWTRLDLVLPLASSILMGLSIYIMNMAYGYFVESRARRLVAERFGQYVPPEVVDRIVSDPSRYSMQPKAAELTILFADVRGFTGISETLQPEELREYIDEYLTAMSSIIREKHRGTLDKYIGDAVMAFWGAPVDDPVHARNGVLAALQMQKECEVLNAKFAARSWPSLRIGVGLNTGNVRVGDMGSRVRRAYTAMGDAVNVASRLEGRTKYYRVGILVGESTRNAADGVVFREVDRIRVKGKDVAVTVYEPIGLETEIGSTMHEEFRLWTQALRTYRAQQWNQADVLLLNLQRMNPGCGLYAKFCEKVSELRRNPPPPDWDGVTSFDEK